MANLPPSSITGLKSWTPNFSTKLSATPTAVGCTAADATAYAALSTDFLARCTTNENPATRTKVTTEELRVSKNALLTKARQLAKVINAFPGTTDALRVSFGLNPRDVTPTPAPVPSTRPALTVDALGNVRYVDEATPTKRGKPGGGVIGALVFYAILAEGAPAPATPDDAKFFALETRGKFAIPVDSADFGKVLWVMGAWVNGKGQPGPVSAPASARIAA